MVMSLSTTSTPISVIFGPTFSFSINGATYVNFESLYLKVLQFRQSRDESPSPAIGAGERVVPGIR